MFYRYYHLLKVFLSIDKFYVIIPTASCLLIFFQVISQRIYTIVRFGGFQFAFFFLFPAD